MNYKWEEKVNWDSLRNKKILIAGGTGFIGKNVIRFFEKHGICSTVLTRSRREKSCFTDYQMCDLRNQAALEEVAGKYDILIYLAANIPLRDSKKESYADAMESTLVPFINCASAFVQEGVRLIYASSVDVLGACNIFEFTEKEVPGIATPYGLAKYCGEFYARDICASSNAECVILRFAQVYGPNEPIVRIIPIIREAILNDGKFDIWTDGKERRRFLYVDDAVQSIIICMGDVPEDVYNIAGNDIVSMQRLVEMMVNVFEKDFKYDILDKTFGVDNVPDIAKAEDRIGFVPEVSLENGLRSLKGE